MKNPLDLFPVIIEIPIAWGDMDAFRHVNNVRYFRYIESGRIAYMEKLSYMELMERSGVGPILASTQCRYKIPLTFPDVISVGTRVSELKEDRFTMKHLIYSHRFQKTAAEGEGVIVSFDYKAGRKAPVPDEIKRGIMGLEAWKELR